MALAVIRSVITGVLHFGVRFVTPAAGRSGHSDNALGSPLRGHRSAGNASRASSIAGAAFIASTIGFSCGQLIHLLRHRIRFIQMERDALERSTSPA
jgi:hypothetical protein